MKTSPQRVPVVIATQFRGIADLLALVLREEKNFELAAQVDEGAKAIEACAKLPRALPGERPGVLVITDLMLRDMPADELVRRLRAECPGTRVMVCSRSSDIELTREALDARPHGFAHLAEPLDEFRLALRAVAQEGSYYSPFAARARDVPSDPKGRITLTTRETEVLKRVAQSKGSKEIGEELHLSPKTVDDYRGRVMNKLNIHDVAGLTRYALKHGLLS